jgi:hypothetical protein
MKTKMIEAKPMKRLLVALTLLFTSLLPISAAPAAPTDDPVFNRLDQWASALEKTSSELGLELLRPRLWKP